MCTAQCNGSNTEGGSHSDNNADASEDQNDGTAYQSIADADTIEPNAESCGNGFGGLRLLVKYRLFDKIPMPFIILIGFGIVAAIFLNKTIYGRYLLALGRNRDAARFSGVNTDSMIIGAYVICSVLAGFGGMLFALDQNSVQPSTFGNFYELYAIAGAVLGGCSLRGGEGTISGVIFGTAMVEVIKNSVFFLNVPTESEFTVIGFVILIGVTFDELIKRMAIGHKTRIVDT